MHDACAARRGAARRGVLHDHCVQALPLHMFSLTGFKPSDGSRGVLRFIADLFSPSRLYCPSGSVVVKSKGWVLHFAQPGPVFHNFYDVKKSEIWRRFSTRDAFEVVWSGLRLSDISESVACHIVSCSLSWPRMRRRASETNSDHVTCVCVCVCAQQPPWAPVLPKWIFVDVSKSVLTWLIITRDGSSCALDPSQTSNP